MRRRPAGVSAVRQSRHSLAVGNTAPEISLTRVAVTTRFAILKRDRNVEAPIRTPPRIAGSAARKFFLGWRVRFRCRVRTFLRIATQLLVKDDETNFNESETLREQACGRFVLPSERIGPPTLARFAGLGWVAKFEACGALEVRT